MIRYRSDNDIAAQCGYCHIREAQLTREQLDEWLAAPEDSKPQRLCDYCTEVCRAHARQQRAYAEWVAAGCPR